MHVNAPCEGQKGWGVAALKYIHGMAQPATGIAVSKAPKVFGQAVVYGAVSSETRAWVAGGMGAGLSILDLTPAP